jgi:hypothetical protein
VKKNWESHRLETCDSPKKLKVFLKEKIFDSDDKLIDLIAGSRLVNERIQSIFDYYYSGKEDVPQWKIDIDHISLPALSQKSEVTLFTKIGFSIANCISTIILIASLYGIFGAVYVQGADIAPWRVCDWELSAGICIACSIILYLFKTIINICFSRFLGELDYLTMQIFVPGIRFVTSIDLSTINKVIECQEKDLQNIQDIKKQLDDLDSSISGIKTKISSLKGESDKLLKELRDKTDGIDLSSLEDIETRIKDELEKWEGTVENKVLDRVKEDNKKNVLHKRSQRKSKLIDKDDSNE